MLTSQTQNIYKVVHWSVFHQIRSLIQQNANRDTLIISDLDRRLLTHAPRSLTCYPFILSLCPQFNLLIQAKPNSSDPSHSSNNDHCQLTLSFDPDTIASFLGDLKPYLPGCHPLQSIPLPLLPNDSQRQSDFTLHLIAAMANPADSLLDDVLDDAPDNTLNSTPNSASNSISNSAPLTGNDLQHHNHQLEQQVIQLTEKLQDSLLAAQAIGQAKSEFLAIMSHELRSPLTTIIGMAATLLRYHTRQSDVPQTLTLQKQQEYLETIHHCGEHLRLLVNDILDLSQVEAGKMVLNRRPISVAQIANQTLKLLQDKADAKQIQLLLELHPTSTQSPQTDRDPGSQFEIPADPHRLQQILANLISNAIKFTPAAGKVTVRIWRSGRQMVLQVEDTGIGIPKQQHPLLFQKFQPLDTSYGRQNGGIGLGLALTKQLVELHGGAISMESQVGLGSTFTVHLPIPTHPPIAANSALSERAASTTPRSRILLLEQDEETATLICDLLTAADYQVVWMVDGSAVFRQLEVLQPAIVLLNWHFIGIDAPAMIPILRQHFAPKSVKILVLTAPLPPDWRAAGADGCLQLPVTQAEAWIQRITALSQPSIEPPT